VGWAGERSNDGVDRGVSKVRVELVECGLVSAGQDDGGRGQAFAGVVQLCSSTVRVAENGQDLICRLFD